MTEIGVGPDTAVLDTVAAAAAKRVRMGTAVLLGSTVAVSALNYLYTVCLMWWLPARFYAIAASGSALLLICGAVATASAPWVLAQEVVAGRADAERRRAAASFCIAANLVQGVIGAAIAFEVASRYADGPALGAIAASVILIFAAATCIGYLQGFERFHLIAALRLTEVAVKIVTGAVLVSLGAGAAGVLAGYALGAAVVAAVGLVVMAPDVRLRLSAIRDRRLWARARGVLFIQAGVAILAGADVVMGSVLIPNVTTLATYQVSLIIARIPVVLAGAISIAAFTRLAAARHPDDVAAQLRTALSVFLKVTLTAVVVVATLPHALIDVIFAPAYQQRVGVLLPWTALAGGLIGVVNLLTTSFQAQARFRRPILVLMCGLACYLVTLTVGVTSDGATGLAIGSVLGSALVVVLLVRETHALWPAGLHGAVSVAVRCLLVLAPLVLVRGHVVLWLVWLSVVVAPLLIASIVRKDNGALTANSSGNAPAPARLTMSVATTARPRVLHLAYEDPRRPGAGGGSVRTHEINRRLAQRWDITAVCARYPGCAERVEDGVHYVHIGFGRGYAIGLLSYFAAIPRALRRFPSDLVVEEFAAPFGSVGVPKLTRRPVVGVVQWLFADQMRGKYHLPFPVVEQLGLRTHERLIGVSEDLSADLRRRHPAAEVTTVRNGLNDLAFTERSRTRSGALYLGRLDVAQKGLDMLVDAFASIVDEVDGELFIGGDGPDEALIRRRVGELGLASRVRFLGRVAAHERFDLLAGAQLVVMPSRFETFGMVAAEAMAVSTPVLAFEIPCLQELFTGGCGVQVPAYDVTAFAAALAGLLRDPQRCFELGRHGPPTVTGLRWDEIALHQEDVYRRALAAAPERTLEPMAVAAS